MKKMMKSLMAAIGVALLMTGSVFAADVATIGDVEALKAFAVAVNGGKSYEGDTVTLSADLDLTGVEWTPIGVGTRSSKSYTGKAFKGTFDGGNHTISGLTITSTDSDDAAVGLFGVVDGGTVKNLKLDAVNINVASSDLAGGAIGLMVNNAKAENITVGGSIVGKDGVGGIVGRLIISGTISSCTNNASVTSSYGGIGGIVGKAYYEDGANTALFASVDKCVNNGTITAPMYVGGIVGLARANVTGCINNGVVVGGTQTGGIVGQLIAAGTVSNNENNAKISGKNHLGGIIGDYSQTPAYTYYNVTIANNINRGELAATEQRAAILGCNNIDGFTAMTAFGNVSFYNAEGLELFGNPEDMVIDSTNMFNPAMTLSDFVQKVVAGNGVFDGNGATVQITPVSGDARTETKEGLPDRLQKYTNPEVYYAQYQRFGNLTDVSISNVKFVFVPAPVTVVDAWNTAGATTTADNINGELQLLNAGNVTFINCSFEKISVSPINATAVSVSGCSFNGLDAYAIKDIKASTVTVADTTFADCNGGFWMNAAPAVLSVIGNTFANVGRRGAIQFSANGDYSSTEMTVTGNNVTGGAFLWQLNPTVTYEQVSAILDTAKNTYGTAYVSGSTEPKPPVARIGDVTYATLEAAFAAATEGQTITLLQDAAPALTSQRAITKAAVIDLGGKTLTLTEDDLYFGTTTFQNGNIVVDPSVNASTAVFWMFANQTLTFDNVKVVATGVTGTYLIGLDGNNSDLNLLNGSEILVENTTALDLDIICVNASTGNDIVIDNSKINVTNLDGRVLFRGNYTIKGNSEINLEGITKAGIRIEAGQTLSIEDTASVTITGEPRDGGIHLTDVTATYTKADTATVSATVNRPAIAKIGDTPYYTLADAVAAAQASDEIVLLADATVEGTLALPAGIKLTSNGKTINGSIRMLGDLELNGPLTITGGLWVGTTDGHLTATLSGDKLTASYFVFQRGTYTIDADIDAVYGYLSFEATFEVNSTIHTTGSNGEVLYINGNVTLNDGAVLDSDNSVFVCNDNAVLTLKPGSTVDSNVKITTSGAKVNVDATGMTAGATANITGTVTNSGNGTVAIVNSDMFVAQIVNGKIVLVGYVAKIGEQKYTSLQSAIEAVQNGETVTLLADVDVTTPAYVQNALNHARNVNFTLDLNGKTLTANTGNSVFRFNIANSGATSDVAITIKNGKVVAGASTWCALMASGISADVKAVMNLEDLTVEASKAGDLAIKAWANGVVNASNVTVNATNAAGGFYAVGGEIVLNDCTVNQKGLHTAPYLSMAFAVSDSGKMTVNSGTYSAEPTAAAEGYNQGTTHGSWVGGVMNSGGTLIINGGTFSNGNFGEDSLATAARGLIFGDTASNIRINGGTFNALKSVIDYQNNLGVQPNPNIVIAGGTFSADPTVVTSYGGVEIAEGYVVTKNNGVWTVAKAVAKIGAGYYTNLVDAFKAATEGCTIEILSDVTIDYKWDCRDYATGGSHSQFKESVTINGNGHTLKFTGTVNDSNWNTIFRFEENATVNNLTVDISEATGAQRVISAKKSLTVDGLTVVGSAKYGIIFGEGASAADLAAAEIVVKNSTLTGTRRAISDNEGGKDVKSVAITDNTLNANVYASASESITFNNNTAAGEVDLRSYTAENVLSVEAKGNTLTEGVKNYIYAKNIDAQEGFTAERVPTTVSTYEQLIAALAEDNAYVVLANDITATATQSSGYGKAGIVVEAGDVLDGNDKTLTINGANATWDCAIAMRGGEVKNLTIAGAMRGVFMPGANGDVVIDNCKFQDVIYTFNSDGGSKDYTVTIKNTELNGWTSFSDVHKAVVFDTCTFAKGNGYAYCRPYQATTFKDCSFSGDFEIDCSRVADNKLAFNGCTYNGQAITSENAFDLFGDGAKVLVNGAPADYTKVAQVGDNYYTSINAALAAAQDGDTVYVFAGDYTQDLVIDKDITVIGETTDTGYQLAAIWGQLQITADGATVKGFYVYDDDTAAYVNAKDVLIEGCELVGAGWAGLYQSYTDGTVTFKDSTIVGATYGIHFDGSDGGNIIIDNCKIQGWTSFASTINNVAISNSEFAEGYYNQLRFYQNAQLTNVTFNENMTIDFGKDDVDASFSGCSVENGGSLLDVIYLDDIYNMGVDVTIDDAPVVLVAKIGDKYYTTLQAALDAAVAGTGNVTVEILSDIDLTGTDWNPVTVSAPGYPFVTVNGNNKTIKGLNDMLFAGTRAGKSGLVINDLTIADSTIVNDEDDAQGTVGVGAFIGFPQASATVTLNNCHLRNSTVNGGHWTGGLIGYAAGYAGTDGPVFMTLTITNCSVTASTITGKGSAGGIIGHGSGNAWTDVIIVDSTVSGNTITSTGSSNNKAGSVMGTIGAAGQPTTVNGVTKTGGMAVSVTTAGNTVKSADTVITTIYGRQGTSTGLLEVTGGTYEANPIEEGVAYASPIDGYKIAQNTDGTYGLKSALPGEGTEASPYIIATVEDLVYFRDYVNSGKTKFNAPGVYIALGDNIDLSSIDNWIPIGVQEYDAKYVPVDPTKVFRGIFDGNGRVISNLKMSKTLGGADPANDAANLGLFGVTGEGAVIKNLTISNVTVNSDGRNVAAVVGHAHKTTLENITVNGKIEITGGHYVAGVCGLTRTMVAGKNLTVSGGAGSFINGQNMVGGIFPEIQALWGLGYSQSFSSLAVENIAINGRGGVGGILGMLAGNGTVTDVSVKNVVLTGRTDYQGDAMGRIRMGLVAGLMGGNGPETIANIVAENVSGKNLDGNAVVLPVIGANYDASSNATEAKIGDKYYATFAKAYAAAQAGDTIELLADIEASEVILIDKNLTINGNGHKVTSSATRVFRVTAADTEVTLNDVNMVSTAVRVGTNDIRGISIDDVNNVKLTLNNCSVDFTDASANDWAYAVNVTGGSNHTLTVNGGTYEGANVINVRGENNTVVVKNATLNSLYPDNEQYYGAGIWVEQEKGSSVKATGNTFNGTNALAFNLGTGTSLTASNNTDNTSVGAAFAVAKIGDKGYMTLASAIAAVKNGETIVLVKDCAEKVTISQKSNVKFTIDGDGHEFTGTITVNNRNTTASLTLKDIAFVSNVNDRQIVTIAKANYVTIDGCSFAGNGTGYGIKLENSNNNNIVVKNTTASNLFDFVYSSKRVNGFTAENITATDVCYGFFLSYGQDLMFTNVNVTASDCGIAMNNYNSSTATFADCKLTAKWPVYMQSKSASNAYTLVFNGTNVLTTSVAGDDLIYVEPTAAVFKAIVNDDNLDMSRCSGFVASIGNTYYNNLQRAVDAAEDGETVSVANDAVLTWDGSTKVDGKYAAYVCVAGKSVTIDLNGKKLTGDTDAMGSTALFAVFASDEGGALTMIDSIGDGSVAVSGATKSYCFFIGYEPGAKLTVEGGSYSLANASDSMIYSGGASDIVTIKGGVFHLGNVGTGTNGQPWIFNAYQQNANSVTVSGGTFNADVGHQFWANEVMISETLACKANGNGTWTIVPAVAYVAEKATSQGAVSRNVGYATFAEAIAAAEKHNAVMTILAGSYDEDLNIDKDITVIGETTDDGYQLVEILGRVNVTADGATVKGLYVYDDDTALYINAKDVLIEGCELVGAGWAGLYQSYTDGTVTFKDSTIVGATYGIHFDGSEGGNIIIDNCKIQGWTSFASTINKVTIKDTEFAEGYENQLRFYQDAELTNVTFNEKMTVDFGKDDVDASFTGCTVVDTNADGIVKPLTDVIYKGDIVDMGVDVTIDGVPMYVDAKIGDTFYLTIADAIAAAQAGDAIKLVRDIDLGGAKITVPAGKNITIDLNGKTVSGTHGAEYAMIHVQNGAYMTIDDTVGGGKISCAAGGNNIGAAIWVEGALVQNAGTIEMTGTWTLGFNVDLRPNAWGTAHTVPASFVMNGGKIVSTDTAVRVASNSSDSYPELGVNFTMNGGEIESAWDAIFVQHLYAGDLNINIENGSVSGANSALRIYGDTGSDVDILVKNGAFTGPIKIAEAYVGTDAIAISGGVFSVPVEESCCAEGYIPVAYADGTYGVKPGVFTVRLNGAGFETLQAALDAAQAGDNEIVLLDDSDETVIVSQTEGVNITIDGDGYTYTGRINVHGNSRFSDETLTIMNFDFYTEKASHNFIWSDSQVAPARYPHNVTIVDCAFEAGRDVVDSVVGIRLRQGNNINVVNCSAYRLHSLIQATSCGGDGIYVESVEIDKCKNGMSFGTSNFSVVDSEIDTTGAGSYGIRADGSGAYTATVEDCVIDAYIPVLVRNTADDGFTLTVAGDNHFMADNGLMENGESYLVVFSKGDVDAEKAPVAPETTFNLVIEDGSLDPSKVYPGFEALVGTKYFGQLEDAVAAAQNGDTVTVLKNVGTDAAIIVNKVIAIDLNGKTIAATQNDTAGDGVFCVVAPGVLTINDSVGTGVINGVGDNNYNMAIWAKDGGKVVINGGSFTNVGATDTNDPNAHFDLIYVKNGGEVVVNGGHFECETPAFTLNSHDTLKGTITVNGGTFVGFDPRNNAAETAGTTFMAPGKFTMANGNNYVVVEPGSYMLNGVYCAKGTVADIDAAVVGAVTLTTIDGVITAKATFTFKVTAVDTVNPENSPYELTGGTLRPGKTVAVKYIDLATGEESWDKPETNTVTFKLVIK